MKIFLAMIFTVTFSNYYAKSLKCSFTSNGIDVYHSITKIVNFVAKVEEKKVAGWDVNLYVRASLKEYGSDSNDNVLIQIDKDQDSDSNALYATARGDNRAVLSFSFGNPSPLAPYGSQVNRLDSLDFTCEIVK